MRKSPSLWQPLRSSSMHPGSVHKSWTVGMEKRFRLLCSSQSVARTEIDLFRETLISYGNDVSSISRVPTIRLNRHECSRLVIPFCRQWEKAKIPGILTKAHSQYFGAGSLMTYGVAWSLGGIHIVNEMRKLHSCKN